MYWRFIVLQTLLTSVIYIVTCVILQPNASFDMRWTNKQKSDEKRKKKSQKMQTNVDDDEKQKM